MQKSNLGFFEGFLLTSLITWA